MLIFSKAKCYLFQSCYICIMGTKNYFSLKHFLISIILTVFLVACGDSEKDNYVWKTVTVTATAYNSLNAQTKVGDAEMTAWGDRLNDSIKSIAVSRDLIALGLKRDTRVRIDDLKGIYIVNDKMNHRWTKRIDIHMGKSLNKARNWGRKEVTIHYAVHKDSIPEILASN